MKYTSQALMMIFIFLIGMWLILASFRTFYNISKLFRGEKEWFFLSEEKKRQKLYGNEYEIFKIVDTLTKKNDSILLIASDGWPYFYGRYMLYPKKIYWTKLIDSGRPHPENSYTYILIIYPSKTNIDTESFSSARLIKKITSDGSTISVLYKIK